MSTQALPTTKAPARPLKVKMERVNWSGTIILILCAVTVLLPLYVTISMAFKTTSQAVDGNAFLLCAHCAVVLDGQALKGEAVVAFLTGEEGLVGFAVEQSCAQGLHGGLALAHGIQAGHLRQVALQQHQLTLVAQVLLQQGLRAGPCRFLQLAVDVVAQT